MANHSLNTTLRLLLAAAGSCAFSISAAAQKHGEPVKRDMTAAVGHALQADVAKALTVLRAVPEAGLSPLDRSFRACMIDRFGGDGRQISGSNEPAAVSARLIKQFRTYWRGAMLEPDNRALLESRLLERLAREFEVAADWSALESAIRQQLASEGKYVLLGTTGPLRELMVWGRQREAVEQVKLPDGTFQAQVVYLEDFSSLGWGDWATCGRRGAGGWATSNALYAITPRYSSLVGEEFRVTFLGHETQHFADLARFPGIKPWELEYRAKLTELAQARETRPRVLGKFLEDQSDDLAHPHGYANRKVLIDLAARLGLSAVKDIIAADLDALNAAAEEIIRADTAARLRAVS